MTVGVAVVGGVFVASAASAVRETQRQFEIRRTQIHGIATILAQTVKEDVAKQNKRNVADALNGIVKLPDIKFASIKSQAKTIDYSVGTGIVVSRDNMPTPAENDTSVFGAVYLGTYQVQIPVISSGIELATLEVVADISDLKDALLKSILNATGTGLVAALLGMLASWYFQNSISGPISDLRSVMQRVQKTHDFSERANRTTDDETGQLADAFNNMLDEIRRRDEQLIKHQNTLEKRVKERTADLAKAKSSAEKANAAK